MLFLRRKISTLHFNERHSASFPCPQALSCANPLTFIFFLNQLNLHFTEPSQASSFSACERAVLGDVLGCTSGSWSCLREPGPSPLQHDPSDSSNVSFSPSLWLPVPEQLLFSTQAVYVRVWMEAGGHTVGYGL